MSFVPFIWAILGILLIGSEFFIPGFVIFFFGLGAVLNALLTAIIPIIRNSIPLQMILWLATSSISLFGLRRYFAKAFRGRLITGIDDQSVVGSTAVVVEEIAPDRPGRIKFQGTTWTAKSYDEILPAGRTVEILQKDGLTFTVTSSLLGSSGDTLR